MNRGTALRYLGGVLSLPLVSCEGQNCSPVPASAGSAATPTAFGSQIYMVDDVEKAVAAIAGCGGTLLRIGVGLGLDFSDAVFAAAARHGIRVVAISPVMPQPIDPEAYAATCVTLQIRYAKYDPIWEIWNEPDLSQSWGAAADVNDYAKVALPTATALRAAGARDIWSGGTSGLDLSWIAELKNLGAYRVMNGCAVHSYAVPCAAYGQYVQLRGIVPDGVCIHTTETCVPTDQDQVGFIEQMWYVHRILGLSTMIWCELRDGSAGHSGAYTYDYGLLYADYAPKPSYNAIKRLILPGTP